MELIRTTQQSEMQRRIQDNAALIAAPVFPKRIVGALARSVIALQLP
jgi:hypothetical protein